MAKLYALRTIIIGEESIPSGSIFETAPLRGKHLIEMGAARTASADEIAAVDAQQKALTALAAEQAALAAEAAKG